MIRRLRSLIAYEMFLTSAEVEAMLWSRLVVITLEDVGLGNPSLPPLIETLFQQQQRYPRPTGDCFLIAAHTVRLIAQSPKDRPSGDMVNWARLKLVVRDRTPEVPDFAIDMHTRRGWELGRGYEHFMAEGSRVNNEVPNRDAPWRDRILAAVAAGELT